MKRLRLKSGKKREERIQSDLDELKAMIKRLLSK